MNIEQARFNMIEQQIRPWDVLDTSVLSLLSAVRREDFVPEAHRSLAFMDLEIPLPQGGALLAPRVEARLVQDLNLSKHDAVLQIGVGTGYITALLAHKAARVVALDSREDLVAATRQNLRKAGIANADVQQGDGINGLIGQAPFDAILLTGSVQTVPQALLDQLKVGGRLLAIIGNDPVMQATLVTRTGDKQFEHQELFDTVVPRLPGFANANSFTF
jgi:protein-L-isoaspartate(D-aspartate) O-methyltransferase